MKRLGLLLLLAATPAFGQQQQQPPDPALAVCQNLSMQKEGNLTQAIVQIQSLTKQLEDAKADLAKAQAPDSSKK